MRQKNSEEKEIWKRKLGGQKWDFKGNRREEKKREGRGRQKWGLNGIQREGIKKIVVGFEGIFRGNLGR